MLDLSLLTEPRPRNWLNFQALYKEDFEKSKGKGFSVVVDTPEMQRLKKTQDQISNVSYSNKLQPIPHFLR